MGRVAGAEHMEGGEGRAGWGHWDEFTAVQRMDTRTPQSLGTCRCLCSEHPPPELPVAFRCQPSLSSEGPPWSPTCSVTQATSPTHSLKFLFLTSSSPPRRDACEGSDLSLSPNLGAWTSQGLQRRGNPLRPESVVRGHAAAVGGEHPQGQAGKDRDHTNVSPRCGAPPSPRCDQLSSE